MSDPPIIDMKMASGQVDGDYEFLIGLLENLLDLIRDEQPLVKAACENTDLPVRIEPSGVNLISR